ncbi:MBL fold metallo-hydrolase [Microbacterium aquimaris]|uniref:MBL fold metallo-hydrolase n=1 Tax=Microbacterium aquimaris TaxID=459816 RepID=UPI002AD20AF2|nr:MBL fold metallo-hydrolase [Microbacterium aquimaris]MDZ8275362.1 MBL fold metallo-hydrolase [Microbacterium aquimaris]
MSEKYRVIPLVEGFPGKSATHGAFGWSSLWLLDDGARRVLVDAGHPGYVPLIHEGLERAGLRASDITDVLITHMHWDHVANVTMFDKATVWVGADELEWAAQQPIGTPFIPDLHVKELRNRRDEIELIAGEAEVLPGIHVLTSPGHTPHHLAFFVEGDHGGVIFAGDSVKNIHELTTGRADSTLDAAASTCTVNKLRSVMAETGAALVPGHDVALRLIDGAISREHPPRVAVGYIDADGEHDRHLT